MYMILLMLISCCSLFAQTLKHKDIVCLQADANNNLYVLEKNRLTRYNSQGEATGYYSDFKQGTFSQLDVSNPMKILIFHEDMQRVTLLDRSLNNIRQLQLVENRIVQVGSACLAANGDMWVFDIGDMRLKRVRILGTAVVLTESQPVTVTPGFPFYPIQMIEYNGQVILADSMEGIICFDLLGNFIRKKAAKGIQSIHLFRKQLYGYNGQELIHFPENGREEEKLSILYAERIALIDGKLIRKRGDLIEFADLP